jgi:hypothetical protein
MADEGSPAVDSDAVHMAAVDMVVGGMVVGGMPEGMMVEDSTEDMAVGGMLAVKGMVAAVEDNRLAMDRVSEVVEVAAGETVNLCMAGAVLKWISVQSQVEAKMSTAGWSWTM